MAGSKNVLTATDSNFGSEVVSNSGVALVDFWAEWCGPCRMIAPTVDQIADELVGKIKVLKLNVDEHPNTAAQFRIRSIPTLLVFKGGQVVDQIIGSQPKEVIVQTVKKHLN